MRLAMPFARSLVEGFCLCGDCGVDAERSSQEWERDLLAHYLELFSERPGTRPDFDESFLHYRQQIVHALLMWTITSCHSPLLPNMQSEETTLTMIERIATAMANLDSIDSIRDV